MMRKEILALCMPLGPTPLLWLAATLAAYTAARKLRRLSGGSPYINPVLVAILIITVLVLATGTSYQTYLAGAQFINFLLGPATVSLAVPLARNLHHVRRSLRGIGLALLAGSATSIISGAGLVWLLGGSRLVAFSMAPKAATTPIAMAVSQEIGGMPPLTAAFAIMGGILAAIVGQRLLKQFKIDDWRAHGLAAGVAGSGIAAAQLAPLNGLAAAFAALGIALNGILTAAILPFLALLWVNK
jgi:predicted murein hydrolase (TIGR00659 family)